MDVIQKISWQRKIFGRIDFWDLLPYRWRHYYWDNILPIIKPRNVRYRKAVPRTWRDVSSLAVDVNFEFIKGFYEDEYKAGIVNWDATEEHKEFATWLENTYIYITVERLQLEKDLDNAYPPHKPFNEMFEETNDVSERGQKLFKFKDDGKTYEEKYGEVNRIEKLIDDKDTEVLTKFIKRRHYFWT